MHLTSSLGMWLLAIWLMVWGVHVLVPVSNPIVRGGLGVLAIVTAVFLLIGR
jgi:hypothetical protein